ncbi:cytochrome C [Dyella sp. KRB-257]|uniref:cytochrome C n=1 Tax=Dyella sp. KRB-257 TaxID=3400915 RepID=UPI003C0750BA
MAGGAVAGWRALTASPLALDEAVDQPVLFRHQHHAGQVELNFRCHSTAETSAHAGMPPMSTCMKCHSQFYTNQPMYRPLVQSWEAHTCCCSGTGSTICLISSTSATASTSPRRELRQLPRPVGQMPLMRQKPLSMHWCLQCHHAPQQRLRPRSRMFDLAWKPVHQKTLGWR